MKSALWKHRPTLSASSCCCSFSLRDDMFACTCPSPREHLINKQEPLTLRLDCSLREFEVFGLFIKGFIKGSFEINIITQPAARGCWRWREGENAAASAHGLCLRP